MSPPERIIAWVACRTDGASPAGGLEAAQGRLGLLPLLRGHVGQQGRAVDFLGHSADGSVPGVGQGFGPMSGSSSRSTAWSDCPRLSSNCASARTARTKVSEILPPAPARRLPQPPDAAGEQLPGLVQEPIQLGRRRPRRGGQSPGLNPGRPECLAHDQFGFSPPAGSGGDVLEILAGLVRPAGGHGGLDAAPSRLQQPRVRPPIAG